MGGTATTGLATLAAALLLWAASSRAQSPAPGEQSPSPSEQKQQQAGETSAEIKATGKERYTLKLCNKSNRQSVFGAIAVYDEPTDNQLTVHAWYKVEKGNCANVATRGFGNYSSHTIFVFGQSGNVIWPPEKNAELNLCVDNKGPYKRVNSKDYKCRSGEVLRKFRKLQVKRVVGEDTEFTYNYN
jgi:hypothetical protein